MIDDETVAQVEAAMAQTASPKDKMARAFEIWSVGPFEVKRASLAAEELVDCNFAFAEVSRKRGYATFEAAIAPVVQGPHCERPPHALSYQTANTQLREA